MKNETKGYIAFGIVHMLIWSFSGYFATQFTFKNLEGKLFNVPYQWYSSTPTLFNSGLQNTWGFVGLLVGVCSYWYLEFLQQNLTKKFKNMGFRQVPVDEIQYVNGQYVRSAVIASGIIVILLGVIISFASKPLDFTIASLLLILIGYFLLGLIISVLAHIILLILAKISKLLQELGG